MNDPTSGYSDRFMNLTTNLFYSLYPINKFAKILYLAPRKHDQTNHNCLNRNSTTNIPTQSFELKLKHQLKNNLSPKSIYLALQNFLLPTMSTTKPTIIRRTVEQNNIQPRTNPFNKKRPRLPHVTQSDLLNINHIHAASLNGIAGQFAQNNQLPAIITPPQQVDNNQQVDEQQQQQSRKPSQSSSVSQFALPPASASLPAPIVELNPTQAVQSTQQQQGQFRIRPTSTTNNSPANQAGSQTSPANMNSIPANNRQQQQVSLAGQNNKFTFMAGQPSTTSTTLPSSTSTTSGSANFSPQNNNQIGSYESSSSAATNAISVHSNNQVNQHLLTSSPSTTSTTTTTTMASNIASNLLTSNNQNGNNHHSGVLPSFSPPIRSQNTLASAKYSLDGIIAVAIFGGFIFLGAIITIIVIIIRR